MSKKFLVLGSSGQIGKFLVHHLIEKKYEVTTFDIIEHPSQDLRKPNNKMLEKRLKECDFVFFLAFDVGGSRYLNKYQHSYSFIDNNMKIMMNTFDLLKKHKKEFIFTSTQMSNMNHSPYGLLKSVGEKLTECLGGLTVKLWNVYGVESDLEKSHVITDFILKARDTKTIDMITDGSEFRQFLHVQDCCECLLKLSNIYRNLDRDEEFHISSFKWNTIKEIAGIVSSNFTDIKIIPSTNIDYVQKDKKNEPNTYILNFWQPKIDIEKGIKKIIKELK
tara:strand:- start:1669 stop:2499 length:831 start_codon:yes stop_codon:yes gene_type:complete